MEGDLNRESGRVEGDKAGTADGCGCSVIGYKGPGLKRDIRSH